METINFPRQVCALIESGNISEMERLIQTHPESAVEQLATGQRFLDSLLEAVVKYAPTESDGVRILDMLIKNGANANSSYFVQSQVGVINHTASFSIVYTKFLFENGARINHDLFGKPACWPLVSAIVADKLDIVQYLVSHGAVVNFVNIHGASPLDYARPNSAVREYLLSQGAKLGLELPKDHMPQPEPETEPEQVTHSTFREFLTEHLSDGPVNVFPLQVIVPSDPPIRLLSATVNDLPALFTDGLAEHLCTVQNGSEGVRRAELMIVLATPWPLDEVGLQQDRYRWPLDWLRKLASYPSETGEFFRRVNVIANGEPPEPLGLDTDYAGWLVRSRAGEKTWGFWQRPDGEGVEVLTIAPLYAEEINLEGEVGRDEFLRRLYLYSGRDWFVEGRPNVATHPPE